MRQKFLILGFFIVIMSASIRLLFAEDIPGLGQFSQGGINSYTPLLGGSNGENINLANGNLILSYVDGVLPGVNGLDVSIQRSLNLPSDIAPVVIDPAMHTGLYDDTYIWNSNVSQDFACWYFENIVPQPAKYLKCGEKFVGYIDRLIIESLNEGMVPPAGQENYGIKEQFDSKFGGMEISTNAQSIDHEEFGTIKTNGDNLVWEPPYGKWLIHATPYIGAIVITNIFPFDQKGQMITLLIKSDGSIDAFNEHGLRISETNHDELYLNYLSQNGNEVNPLKEQNIGLNKKGEDIIHNDSAAVNINSLDLIDSKQTRIHFAKFKSDSVSAKMTFSLMSNNTNYYKNVYQLANHIPYWRIEYYRPENIKDIFGNAVNIAYPDPATVTIEDTLKRSIKIQKSSDQVKIDFPANDKGTPSWIYKLQNDDLSSVIDPVGNETKIYNSNPKTFPLVHDFPVPTDQTGKFIEIQYPTGGAFRFESFVTSSPLSGTDYQTPQKIAAFVTEFPDKDNQTLHFQKFVNIYSDDAADTVTTSVYEINGTVSKYVFKTLAKMQQLFSREINDAGKTVEKNTYAYSYSGSNPKIKLNGISMVDTVRDGVHFIRKIFYDDYGNLKSIVDENGEKTEYEYAPEVYFKDVLKFLVQNNTAVQNLKSPKTILKHITVYNKGQTGVAPDKIDTYFSRTGKDLCNGTDIPDFIVNKIVRTINGGNEEVVRQYCFDTFGNVIKSIDDKGNTTQYSYQLNSAGTLKYPYPTEIIENGKKSTLTYNAETSRLTGQVGYSGNGKNYEYDLIGRLKAIKFANGSAITHEYQVKDAVNNSTAKNQVVTSVVDAIAGTKHTITRQFNGLGMPIVMNRDGFETVYNYGVNKKIEAIFLPGQAQPIQMTYDAVGRLKQKVLPNGDKTDFQYTYLNAQVGGVPVPLSETALIKNNTLTKKTSFDYKGRPVILQRKRGNALLTTTADYSELGLLLQTKSPTGLVTKNVFNKDLKLSKRIYSDGDVVEYLDDNGSDGLLDGIILNDQKYGTVNADFDYDDQGRVISIEYDKQDPTIPSNDYEFTYGSATDDVTKRNKLASIDDAVGKSSFDYAGNGQISHISNTITALGKNYGFDYIYDAFGNDHALEYPNGLKVFYNKDKQGHLSEVRTQSMAGPLLAKFEYDEHEKIKSVFFGNGTKMLYEYDLSARLISIRTYQGSKLLAQKQYSYDEYGNKNKVVYADGSKVIYEYEVGTRWLTKASYYKANDSKPYNVQSYNYDDEGNRITYSDLYKQTNYSVDAGKSNKIIAYQSGEIKGELAYDVRGNLVSQSEKLKDKPILSKDMTYDFQDRLISAKINDKSANYQSADQYVYDYASRRAIKKSNGNTKYYLYGKSIEPMVELDIAGLVETVFIYAGGKKIAAWHGDQIEYFHNDELGSVDVITNDQGQVTQNLRYDLFGNINFESGTSINKYQFASKEKDDSTGLIYFGARYYDPALGRFISKDPVESGQNYYIYAENNPGAVTDYFGMLSWPTGGGSTDGNNSMGPTNNSGEQDFRTGAPMTSGDNNQPNIDIPDMNKVIVDLTFGTFGSSMNVTGSAMNPASEDNTYTSMEVSCDSNDNCDWVFTYTYSERTSGNFDERGFNSISSNINVNPTKPDRGLGNAPAPASNSYSPPPTAFDPSPVYDMPDFPDADYIPPPDFAPSPASAFGTNTNFDMNSMINQQPIHNGNPAQVSSMPSFSVPQMNPGVFPTNMGITNQMMQPPSGLPELSMPQPYQLPLATQGLNGGSDSGGLTTDTVVSDGIVQPADTEVANNTGQPTTNKKENDDPVLLFNGDLLQEEHDLSVPGRGLSYLFDRTYHSHINYLGPLGYGWDHNYNKRLVVQKNGDVLRHNGKGRYDIYKNNNGVFASPAGYFDLLTKSGANTYQITDAYKTVENYDADGFVATRVDRYGNTMKFIYDGSGQDKQLSSVTDPLGHIVNYKYITTGINQGRLESITDQSGRKVQFKYDTNNNLVAVVSPATSDYPNGKEISYTYSEGYSEFSDNLNHNLLTVTDAKGQTFLKNEYSSQDRVIKQTFGYGAFSYQYDFNSSFNQCESSPSTDVVVSETLVTDRVGNLTRYKFNCQGQPLDISEYTKNIRPDDPAAYITKYKYNQDGLTTEATLPAGNVVVYDYQAGSNTPARGNVVKVTNIKDATRPGVPQLITQLSYEPQFNQLQMITDPAGQTTTRVFDAKGNIKEEKLPLLTLKDGSKQQISNSYTYNTNGQIESVLDGEGHKDVYEYGASGPGIGQIKKITQDVFGKAVTHQFTYNNFGFLDSYTDGNGKVYQLSVNALGQIEKETAPTPFLYEKKIAYDANNNIEKIELQNSNADGSANVVPWVVINFSYDMLDHVISRSQTATNQKSVLTEYQYDKNENLVRTIQPEGNGIKINYDERDKIYQYIKGYGSTQASITTVSYDPNGNISKVKGAMGANALFDYDGYDRLIKVANDLGSSQEYVFDAAGQLTQIKRRGPPSDADQNSVLLSQTDFAFDPIGRLTQQNEALIDETFTLNGFFNTQYEYNKNHQPVLITNPKNQKVTLSYDGLKRLEKIQDALGNQLLYGYDANNNITSQILKEIDAQNNSQSTTTNYAYDALNRLTKLTRPSGQTLGYQYNSLGQLVATTDAKDKSGIQTAANTGTGNRLLFEYDGLNRLITAKKEMREGGNGSGKLLDTIQTNYQYDDNGRIKGLTDPKNNLTQFAYDAMDRRIQTTLPDGKLYQYGYNVLGGLVSYKDPAGNVVSITRDLLNRATDKKISVAGNNLNLEQYEYDGMSRVIATKTLNPQGATLNSQSYQYDSLGRIIKEDQDGQVISASYDAASNLSSLNYPSGKMLNLNYDALNRLDKANDADLGALVSNTYGLGAQLASQQYVNNTEAQFNYDNLKRPETISFLDANQTLMTGTTYGYDGADELVFEKKLHQSGKGNAYYYDSANRLTQAKLDLTDPKAELANPGSQNYQKNISWNLDKANNPLTKSIDTTKQIANDETKIDYTLNNLNQITKANADSFEYDANGNLISDGQFDYDYDYRNFLTQVSQSFNGQPVATYEYDTLGRRITKANPQTGEVTHFIYSGHQLIEERDENNQVIATYVYGSNLDDLVMMERDGKQYYYHKNYQGSVVAISDEKGQLVERYEYEPYGSFKINAANGQELAKSSVENHFYYAGREYEAESGLYYYRARYFSPELGRFLQRDPIGYGDDTNLYAYVGNDPMNWIDPFGLSKWNADVTGNTSGFTNGKWDGASGSNLASEDPFVNGVYRQVNNVTGVGAFALNYLNNVAGLLFFDSVAAIEELSVAHGGPNALELQINSQMTPMMPLDDLASGVLSGIVGVSKNAKALGLVDEVVGLDGITSIAKGVGQKPIIIGENMRRVKEYADKVGGHAYRPWVNDPFDFDLGMMRNERWIKSQIRDGRTVVDIGPDFQRRTASGRSSPFYEMERHNLKGYDNYQKSFERSGNQGGVQNYDF